MGRSKFVRVRLIATLAVAGLLAACGSGAAGGKSVGKGDAEINLRYAFFAPAKSFPAVQMEEWAKQLNERTKGKVSVELFPGGTLLGTGDIFDGVSSGVVDVGMDSPAYDVGRFPLSSALSLPVGFPNSQIASRTMLDLLEEFKPKEFAKFEVITAFTTEPAYLQTGKPVTSRKDLSGLELRSAGAGVPALKALGASPVGMPMPEVAEGLQTGVLEGYMSSREVLKDFGLAEQVRYVSDYAFGISNTFVAVMDKKAFDKLPPDVQDVIRDLRQEMTEFASKYHDDENVGPALDWAESKHGVKTVELDDAEREAWDKAIGELVGSWQKDVEGRGFDPKQVLDRMNELREKYTAELGS